MSDSPLAPTDNQWLKQLPPTDRAALAGGLECLELDCATVLYTPGEPIQHAYFPCTAVISVMATLPDHHPLQMGLIGSEGMLGASLALGIGSAPMLATVHAAGSCLRLNSADLQAALAASPLLLRRLGLYLHEQVMQISQSAACSHFHGIEQRLARWLLLTHDRAHADHFHLTHERLANMLGVRRSGVTLAAGWLQHQGLIQYTRGDITIVDRKGLEAASCSCYGAPVPGTF